MPSVCIRSASRAAPSPPACDVVQCASALTSGRAFFTAIANPHERIAGRSMISSPTKAASAAAMPSFSRICAKHRSFVLNALVDVLHLQIPRPQGHGFGDALGDDSGFDSRHAGQHNGSAVMGVEALGLDQTGAVEPAAASSLRFRDIACRRFESALGGECPLSLPGAGKIQILPSVRTPSTSKRMSLILRARAVAEGLGIARDSSIRLAQSVWGRATRPSRGAELGSRRSQLPAISVPFTHTYV